MRDPQHLNDTLHATDALINWFGSQNIDGKDAVFMCSIITAYLVNENVCSKSDALTLLGNLIDGPPKKGDYT